ncbi:MAG: O-antigen translocase [Bacteroidota bacterium]
MQFVKNILKSPLVRLTSLNSLSVVTRVIGGLLASKMTAIFIGPSGLALTGSFRNFLASLDAFSTLGLQNGIIKYTAQHEKEKDKLYRSLATSFIVIGMAVIVCAVVLILPAAYWSARIFNGNREYGWIFSLTGFALPLYSGSLLFMAVLNGFGKYRQVIWITIWSYAVGVLLSALLIYKMGLSGAFIGLLGTPFLMCIFAIFPVYKLTDGFAFLQLRYFDRAVLRNLLSFSLMSVISAILGPTIYIALRNMLIGHSGGDVAGYWEGINRISAFYMMFISTFLGVYFLPKLSQATSDAETKGIFRSYYKLMVPLFSIGLLLVYVLRKFIISAILSEAFMPMEKLFIWQIAGDFCKVCSLILGHEFFAKKMTRAFIFAELLSFAILYTSGKFLITQFGAEGAVMGHAFTCLMSLVVLTVYFRKKLF